MSLEIIIVLSSSNGILHCSVKVSEYSTKLQMSLMNLLSTIVFKNDLFLDLLRFICFPRRHRRVVITNEKSDTNMIPLPISFGNYHSIKHLDFVQAMSPSHKNKCFSRLQYENFLFLANKFWDTFILSVNNFRFKSHWANSKFHLILIFFKACNKTSRCSMLISLKRIVMFIAWLTRIHSSTIR